MKMNEILGTRDSTLRCYGTGFTSVSSDATIQVVLAAKKSDSGPLCMTPARSVAVV